MSEVEAAAKDGVIEGIVIPFNGVLVTRALVEKIGPVREEFFIWGDDVEFRLRAERAGARIATVVDSHFLHPATDDLGTPMMFGRTTYNHSPSDLKHYCMARNNVVNLRDYRGWLAVLAFLREDGVVLHVHPARSAPAPAERRRGVGGPDRRLHRPSAVPEVTEPSPSSS